MIREYWIVLGIIILALLYVLFNFIRVKKMDEGTDEMKEMAGIIRSGASMFLKTEFKTVTIVVLVLALVFPFLLSRSAVLPSSWAPA